MSGYNGGQFDDADGSIERRIQEELRARQAASARVTGALSRTGFTDRAFMSSLIAAESAAAAAGQAGAPFYPHPGAAGAHFVRAQGSYSVTFNPSQPKDQFWNGSTAVDGTYVNTTDTLEQRDGTPNFG